MSTHNTVSSNLTDNERRVMALLSLNKNPYDFEGINYVDAIVKEFDGAQFGEKNLVNDDMFVLIVLPKVGYTFADVEIKKTIFGKWAIRGHAVPAAKYMWTSAPMPKGH